MTRQLGPTPADDISADLEPIWDRLADHAEAAPHARPELTARVQGALLTEFDRTLRPAVHRPLVLVRPLFRPASLRSLLAAAALVALVGVSVALAGAGVARLQQPPAVVPTPAVEEPSDDDTPDVPGPILQPPARPGPDGIEDPDENDDDEDDDEDDNEDDESDADDRDDAEDEDGADDETHEPDADADADETAEPDDAPDQYDDRDPDGDSADEVPD